MKIKTSNHNAFVHISLHSTWQSPQKNHVIFKITNQIVCFYAALFDCRSKRNTTKQRFTFILFPTHSILKQPRTGFHLKDRIVTTSTTFSPVPARSVMVVFDMILDFSTATSAMVVTALNFLSAQCRRSSVCCGIDRLCDTCAFCTFGCSSDPGDNYRKGKC